MNEKILNRKNSNKTICFITIFSWKNAKKMSKKVAIKADLL